MCIGKDYSVGILLSILIHYFDLKGDLCPESGSRGNMDGSV